MNKTLGWMYGAVALVIALGALAMQDAVAAPPGPEVCKGCHEAYFNSFSGTVHGNKSQPRSPASNAGCANCHSTHGDRDTLLKITNPQIAPLVNTSRVPQQEVCFTCHRDIRALVMRPSHHPIVEGKVKCTSCHNPHGALSPAMVNAESIKELCTTCHADKRGPFLYEHAPVEESCLNCHNPHGARTVKLLNEKVPNLCQDCHDAAQHPGTMYDADNNFTAPVSTTPPGGPNTRFIARSCMNCHNEIHGSNRPAAQGKRFIR